jgi:hypothetical protein
MCWEKLRPSFSILVFFWALLSAREVRSDVPGRGLLEAGMLAGGGVAVRGKPGERARYTVLRSLSYFVTRVWQIGGALGVAGGFERLPASALETQVTRHWHTTNVVVLYTGAHAGVSARLFAGDTQTLPTLGGHAGVKYVVAPRFSVGTEVRFTATGRDLREGFVSLLVGASWFFASMSESARGASLIQYPRDSASGTKSPIY